MSLKKLQIKTNPDNATHSILTYKVVLIEMWCDFKYYYFFCYPKTSFVIQFFYIKVSFRVIFPWTSVSHFLKKERAVTVQKVAVSVMTYTTASIRNLLILPLRTTLHSLFFYVHIRLTACRIAIKPNYINNYYNISNVRA